MFEHKESWKKDIMGPFYKSAAREIIIIYFLCKVYKRLKYPFIFILIVKFRVSQ